LNENPYAGLRPFDLDDRDRFFGRARDGRDVRALWLANRLLVVYGASGAGKTSLIQAGVLPLFRTTGPDRDATVLPVGRLPQGSAYPTVAREGSPHYESALISSWARGESAAELPQSIADFLNSVPPSTDRYGDELPLLAVIDQFEELFVGQRDRVSLWDGFLRQLAEAIKRVQRLHMMISIREDFVADLLPYETIIAGHSRARFRVRALDRTGALEAVIGPLTNTRRTFAPGVAEALVDDLRTLTRTNVVGEIIRIVSDRIEPIQLQVACSGLWNALPDDVSVITSEHLRGSGDVDQMLLEFCRKAVFDVSAAQLVLEAEIWGWLAREFITETGRRGTVYEGVTSTAGMPNEVARSLEIHRVLRAEERLGSRWYELLHDRLIEAVQEGAGSVAAGEVIAPHVLPMSFLRTAESALADGDTELSEKYAREGLRRFSEDALRGQAEAHALLGRIAEARDHSTHAELNYRAAEQLYEQLQDERAVGRLQVELGRLFGRRGDSLAAQMEYERALRVLVGDVDVRVELARALRRSGRLAAALGHLGTALTLDPSWVPALTERGLTYDAMGDRAAALADLENAIRLSPTVAERDDVRRVLEAG
jgi:hypothetical protein